MNCTCCVFPFNPDSKLLVNYCRTPNKFKVKKVRKRTVVLPELHGPVSSKKNWFPKWTKK